MQLTRLDYEGDNLPNDQDVFDKIQRPSVQSDISPYRMHGGNLRRPNGESDHGYSTMTPHEDSDHACFTLVEPLIRSRKLSVSDSTSINGDIGTNSSSPLSYNCHRQSPFGKEGDALINRPNSGYENTGATILSSPRHIQAPVTVHQAMEA